MLRLDESRGQGGGRGACSIDPGGQMAAGVSLSAFPQLPIQARSLYNAIMRTLPLLLLVWMAVALETSLLANPSQTPPQEQEQTARASPDTRAELWRQERLRKRRELQPDLLTGLEKGLLWMEQTNFLEINYKGFYPRFSSLGVASGFAPGIRYWKPNLNGSFFDFQASAAYSTRGYQRYDLQLGKILLTTAQPFLEPSGDVGISQYGDSNPGGERFFIYGDLAYRVLPQEDFYGIGSATREEDRTDFQLRESALDLVTGYEFNRYLSAAFRIGFLDQNTSRGTDDRFPPAQDVFDEATAPGITRQPNYVRMAGALFVDYRDRLRNPHSGGILSFSIARYDEREGSSLQFNRYVFDARHYLPLGSVQRVLAVHFFTSWDDADQGAQVPFYLQNTLGGTNTLRGYQHFRFRDVNLLYLSAEYRWEAAPALEFAVFYDTGKVFSNRSDFDLTGLRKSFGGGVRIKTSRSVVLRLDAGRSDEGGKIYFTFGPAF